MPPGIPYPASLVDYLNGDASHGLVPPGPGHACVQAHGADVILMAASAPGLQALLDCTSEFAAAFGLAIDCRAGETQVCIVAPGVLEGAPPEPPPPGLAFTVRCGEGKDKPPCPHHGAAGTRLNPHPAGTFPRCFPVPAADLWDHEYRGPLATDQATTAGSTAAP
jgi:hypothetical protein